MDRINPHDEKYSISKLSTRQQRLLDKFKVKTYAQRFKALFIFCLLSGFIFQIASFCTAITLPASWFKSAFGMWGPGFVVAGVFLLLLEIAKRFLVKMAAKNYWQYKKKALILVALLPSALSIISSTLGTPIAIKSFGAVPDLIDTTTIASDYDAQITSAVAYWSDQEAKAKAKGDEIHRQNNWRDVTVKDARDDVLKERGKESAFQDSSVAQKSFLASAKLAAIQQAVQDNELTISTDASDKEEAGLKLGLVTLGLELLFMMMVIWCEYYDYRETLEIEESQLIVQAKSQPKSADNKGDSAEKVDESGGRDSDRNRIGFNVSEGTVRVNEKGTPVIAYQTKTGKTTWYRSGQLSSQITDAEKNGRKNRVNRLTNLKKILEKWNK